MSNSPRAQAGHGSGSGRRTIPTTRSPGRCPAPSGALRTRPSDSCPRTRRSAPGGAQPYPPAAISRSVPHTPSAIPSTSSSPSPGTGSGTSVTASEPRVIGTTVNARMARSFPASSASCSRADRVPGLPKRRLDLGDRHIAEMEDTGREHRVGARRHSGGEILDRTRPAAGDHWHVHHGPHLPDHLKVEPVLGAVGVHRVEQDLADAELLPAPGPLD